MSFSIKLQTNASENNRLDKTLTDITTISGVLKDKTSIIDPVIMVECDLTDLIDCNYMTIASFGRSYFVTNIVSVRNNLCEISAHVDVLSSFKTEIRSNSAIVRRQQNNWNLYLDDGVFKTYQNPYIITKEFPTGFTAQEFVLAVAGS